MTTLVLWDIGQQMQETNSRLVVKENMVFLHLYIILIYMQEKRISGEIIFINVKYAVYNLIMMYDSEHSLIYLRVCNHVISILEE